MNISNDTMEVKCVKKSISRLFPFVVLVTLLFTFIPLDLVFAEDVEDGNIGKENLDEGIFTKSSLAEEDDKFYYRLEATMADEDKSKWYNIKGKLGDAVSTAVNEPIMILNRVVFWVNMKLSQLAIGALEMAINMKFIESAIDLIYGHVVLLVGISGTSFAKSGMFYNLAKITALFVVIYAFYQLVWKRSFISSFGEMFKFVIVLTVALLMIGNYGTFLKTANKVSNEIGDFIVGSPTSSSMNEALWAHLIDKPYLTMQYGTDDLSKIGDGDSKEGLKRVRELLTARTGSSERIDIVDEEVNELGNYYMTYNSINEKLGINFLFLLLNLFTIIPLFLIALAIMFTQIWFVIIAIFAPFALIVASFPTQFGVLKRYFFELFLPLMAKIGLHFVLVMIIFLTTLVTGYNDDVRSDLLGGHIGTAFINATFYQMLFIGIFLLRKRIMNMLTSGSEMMGSIRESMGSPVKSTVQSVTAAGGAVVGGIVAGPKGIAVGANVGGTVGKIATGESEGVAGAVSDIGQAGSSMANLAYQNKMLDAMEERERERKEQDEIAKMTPEQRKAERYKETQRAENTKQGRENAHEFAKAQGMNERKASSFVNRMEKAGIDMSKVTSETLKRHDVVGYDDEGNPIGGKAVNDTTSFINDIKEHQKKEATKISKMKSERISSFNDFMKEQNMTQAEIQDVHNHLQSKAIDPAKIYKTDYIKADEEIRARLEKGESISYTNEFKRSLERKTIERQNRAEQKRVEGVKREERARSTLEKVRRREMAEKHRMEAEQNKNIDTDDEE